MLLLFFCDFPSRLDFCDKKRYNDTRYDFRILCPKKGIL